MVLPEGSSQIPDHNTSKLASQAEELNCYKNEEHAIDYVNNDPDTSTSSGLDDSEVVSFSSPMIWQHLMIINKFIDGSTRGVWSSSRS
jgi:hypothetical protein